MARRPSEADEIREQAAVAYDHAARMPASEPQDIGAKDPFRLGFRERMTTTPDGRQVLVQVAVDAATGERLRISDEEEAARLAAERRLAEETAARRSAEADRERESQARLQALAEVERLKAQLRQLRDGAGG